MSAIASQITSLTIVLHSTVYSDADQRKHQSSALLTFVWGIHRRPVNSPHKWPVTRKMFSFDDVIMCKCICLSLKARVTLYTAGLLHTAVPHCSHSRAPIVHTAVPRENNEHGCVYLRCRAVCKLPGCVEGHPWKGQHNNWFRLLPSGSKPLPAPLEVDSDLCCHMMSLGITS